MTVFEKYPHAQNTQCKQNHHQKIVEYTFSLQYGYVIGKIGNFSVIIIDDPKCVDKEIKKFKN